MTNRHYAKYTQVFADVLVDEPTILDNLQLDTEAHTASFRTMLKAKYYNYEISGETIGAFKEMLEMRFNQYKDYYIEFLKAYETKIDMLDGRKTTRTYTETKTRTASGESKGTNETNETYTDLPRSDSTKERPTSKTNSVASPTSNYKDNVQDTNTREAVMTGMDTQADLKKKYIELIRNVYEEFADSMKPCFLTLFY